VELDVLKYMPSFPNWALAICVLERSQESSIEVTLLYSLPAEFLFIFIIFCVCIKIALVIKYRTELGV